MGKREEYKLDWQELLNAKTEEEVTKKLLKIVKSFGVDYYKSDVFSNPYFKSLIPEIGEEVISELYKIRKSLKEEVKAIEEEIKILKKNKDKDVIKKLKSLRIDCELLISELDSRIEEISSNLIFIL